MYGDKLVIYDDANRRYFAGYQWNRHNGGRRRTPAWSDTLDGEKRSNVLSYVQKHAKALDGRIMSESAARKMEMLQEYRLLEVRGNA